ncbi:hypothetical protein PPACK8108_LOCUS17220 [Phakopsora pachyrhizi]|uniref:Uncharacterized protein n=1 Tax=Phakopsora pachyrhizi TaxID=170000 RepID=A0AAV0BC52_PHAPC|nr:hypothetical protein PPACK8108_LOCUS17220 [Phakopsora pachyrhizi]
MPSTRAQSRASSHARPRSEIFGHDLAQNSQPASSRVSESRSSRQQTPADQHPETGSESDGNNQGMGHSKTDKSFKPSSKEIPRPKTQEKTEEARRLSKSDLGQSEQYGQSHETQMENDHISREERGDELSYCTSTPGSASCSPYSTPPVGSLLNVLRRFLEFEKGPAWEMAQVLIELFFKNPAFGKALVNLELYYISSTKYHFTSHLQKLI